MIFRLTLALLPVMMAVAQARAQGDTVCVGQTSTWMVVNVPGDTYTWELYNDVSGINFATDPGNCPPTEAYFVDGMNTGDSVNVMCLLPGTYFLKVTAVNSCPTDNLKIGMIVVEECYSVATLLEPDSVCAGDTALLTVEITGAPGPWDVTFTDGTSTWTIEGITSSPHTFPLVPTPSVPGNYQYWVTSVSNPYMTNNTPGDPVTLEVNPIPVTSPIYRYDPVTANKK
jgi:hypothetical protein